MSCMLRVRMGRAASARPVVEDLTSMQETLGSTLSTTDNTKQMKNKHKGTGRACRNFSTAEEITRITGRASKSVYLDSNP